MTRTHWISGLIVIAGASSAGAQSKAVLGKDDAAFAQKLMDNGYGELAAGLSKLLAESGTSDIDKVTVLILKSNVALDAARSETDPLKRKALLLSVLKDKQAIIDEFPRTPQADEQRAVLPDLYRMTGDSLLAAIEDETDPQKAGRLREEAQRLFSEVEDSLEQRIKKFQELLSDPNAKEVEYFENQLFASRYGLARILYFNSRLYAKGDPNKTLYTKQAIDAFQEFSLDYGDTLQNYDGLVFQGLANKDIGENGEAMASFDDAIALRETWEPDAKGVFAVSPEAADSISDAVLQKILLLAEQQEYAKAKETVDDFLATIPDALQSRRGLAVLAALADAQIAAGDREAANETAQKLDQADPNGPWGARGRQIIGESLGKGGGGDLGAENLLKIGYQTFQSGNYERAAQIAQLAFERARGTANEIKIGSDALILLSTCYSRLERFQEASIANDAVAELYPKGEQAAEALYRSASIYNNLYARDKRPFYRKRFEDRQSQLAQNFPNAPQAAQARMFEGEQLESEREYLKAAEFYKNFQAGTAGYERSQVRAGTCYLLYAAELARQKKTEEAATYFKLADETLTRIQKEMDAVLEKTLDRDVVARLGGLAFDARLKRAQIYLQESVNRPQDVFNVLQDVEAKFGEDPNKVGQAYTLRVQALQSQGKLDEAVAMYENLRAKDPNEAGLAQAASALARALDKAGAELRAKDGKSSQAEDYWKKAAKYYWVSIGLEPDKELQADISTLEPVALRLYVFGMHFNGVPDDTDTFVGRESAPLTDPSYFENAAALYRAMLARAPSYKWTMNLGRCYGFLARWKDSANVLAGLFETAKLIEPGGKGFNQAELRARPELIFGYLDWGVAEHMAAVADKDNERFDRAYGIFERLVGNTTPGQQLWWGAKYWQLRNLVDRGNYERAGFILRDLERNTNDFDAGKYGYKPRFEKMRQDLEKLGKVPPKNAIVTPDPTKKN